MHIYLRVLHPQTEDCLSPGKVLSNLIERTQFIEPSWFTSEIEPYSKGGFGFGVDDRFISVEEIQQKLSDFGYIFVI